MPLLRRRPAPPLDAFVDQLWASSRGTCPHPRELNLPTGCADLVISLGQRTEPGVLLGAFDHATSRDTSQPASVVGVHFRPGGLSAFLEGTADEFSNCRLALHELWGRFADELRERLGELDESARQLALLERLLLGRLCRREIDPLVQFALSRFQARGGQASVGAVQRASGVSAETFIARFRSAVGLAPKRYLRVARLRSLVTLVAARGATNWGEVALDFGFADQAHLTREFRALTGLTPGSYRPIASDQPSHVALGASPKNLQDAQTRRGYGSCRPESTEVHG
jgi:AraC-like DNA-binding protein